jgi:hypothetical protein
MALHELSVRSLLTANEAKEFLARHLGIDPRQIGTELEYWERAGTPSPLALGLTVRPSEAGYRSLLTWVQDDDLPSTSWLSLAADAAKQFRSDVAIADVIHPTEFAVGRYLVISPDGEMHPAIESQNSAIFELEPLPEEESIVEETGRVKPATRS